MPDARFADSEFHRRRAEIEMDRALSAREPDIALRHLEMARAHRERREALALSWREMELGARPRIGCTDKEA